MAWGKQPLARILRPLDGQDILLFRMQSTCKGTQGVVTALVMVWLAVASVAADPVGGREWHVLTSAPDAGEICIGCGICVSVCPMDTLSFGANGDVHLPVVQLTATKA